jgi:hypothetical protein
LQGGCAANHACNAAGACELVNGQPCTAGTDCVSGFCSGGDDFCCNVSCTGPCAKCAGGTTCGLLAAGSPGACGGGKACTAAGACVLALTGSGTAASPYTTTPPLTKCSTYLSTATIPSATSDGVYTINPGTGAINVYCDMVHGGITYANFGFGQYMGSYAGWSIVGSADFTGTAEFQAAFAYLYDRNGGLTNLTAGFVSTNCCITDSNLTSFYGIDSSQYMYPYMNGSIACNPSTGYTTAFIQLASGFPTVYEIPTTLTAAQVLPVSTSTSCSLGNNPAVFVQKY